MSPASSAGKGKSAPAATMARAAASEAVRFMRRKSTRVLSRSKSTAWTSTRAESGAGPSRRWRSRCRHGGRPWPSHGVPDGDGDQGGEAVVDQEAEAEPEQRGDGGREDGQAPGKRRE